VCWWSYTLAGLGVAEGLVGYIIDSSYVVESCSFAG
jgi:hypothetical protein